MGYDVTGPQVHADGEIWSATNFRIRTLLNDKYDDDFPSDDEDLQDACANGELPPYACPGNRRWIQLVFDAMLLMPTNPSMLQARDAHPRGRPDAVRRREPEGALARRSHVAATAWRRRARTRRRTRTPIRRRASCRRSHDNAHDHVRGQRRRTAAVIPNARIFVGHYEARVSPIADTRPGDDGRSNLDDTAPTSLRRRTSSSRRRRATAFFAAARFH